jgi:7,8-dihydroneopterin aldolase/epimerase/oxygenase
MNRVCGRVQISGMRFWGKHGATREEQERTQPIDVDLEIVTDLEKAAKSDQLNDTVDYAQLFAMCESAVTQHSFSLLEALARHIAAAVLEDRRIAKAVVRVRKPRFLDGATPQIEIRMQRTLASEGQPDGLGETAGDGGK